MISIESYKSIGRCETEKHVLVQHKDKNHRIIQHPVKHCIIG